MTEIPQHLLDIEDTPVESLQAILDTAQALLESPGRAAGRLRGRLLMNLFYEPSTRTRVSFEVAAIRLGMEVVNIAAADSSVKKGETLRDTFLTLQSMAPDVIVLRHPEDGAPGPLADLATDGLHLVNAGDGSRAHPTQALLDALTLRQHFDDLSRVKVLVAGDLHHSRVTRSGVTLMKKLGVGEIRLAAPPGMQAGARVSEGARLFDELDSALEGVDAVMMLRIQRERLAGMKAPDAAEYHRRWGLSRKRLERAAPHCIVMHPGPMNRGAEIDSDVADGPRSVILQQVRNGVFVRMATLLHLLGV